MLYLSCHVSVRHIQYSRLTRQQRPAHPPSQTSPCFPAVALTLAIVEIALLIGMLSLWMLFMFLAVRTYRKLSYNCYRAANISELDMLQMKLSFMAQQTYMSNCKQADMLNPPAHVLTQCMVVSVQTCVFRCLWLPCC